MTTESVSSQANLLQQTSCTLPVTLVTKNNSSKIIIPCIRYKECSTVVYMPKSSVAYQQACVAGKTNNVFSDKVKVKNTALIIIYSFINTFFTLLLSCWEAQANKQLEHQKHKSHWSGPQLLAMCPIAIIYFIYISCHFCCRKIFLPIALTWLATWTVTWPDLTWPGVTQKQH